MITRVSGGGSSPLIADKRVTTTAEADAVTADRSRPSGPEERRESDRADSTAMGVKTGINTDSVGLSVESLRIDKTSGNALDLRCYR